MIRTFILSIFFFTSAFVQAQQKKFIVAADGTGNYKTVQAALDAVPVNNKKTIIIFIKNGLYKEKLHLDSSRQFVKLIGEDKFNTILTYDDHTGKISPKGDTINTRTSASFTIKANHFSAENITFENNAGFSAGQAVAVESDGDMAIFSNCRFLGFQDVLFTNAPNSRQLYTNCYIEGTTDFIFGSSTVWFERCHIHSKKDSHITAASTPAQNKYGYVFNECMLTADSGLHKVTLGRPWRPYGYVLFMRTYIGQQIIPEGWSKWNQNDNHKTARFAEYKNFGPGSSIKNRIDFGKQLNAEEASGISIINVLGVWVKKFLFSQ